MTMKPEIIISSADMERLEGLLHAPGARNRADLDGLRDELERADVRASEDMPADVIRMNSRARIREQPSGKERELTLVYPGNAVGDSSRISIFSPAGSALLGLAKGQSIDWPTVEGHIVHLEVLEVTNPASVADDGR
ncbi:nucleoside diphosphate kinase regulator [Rhodocyclaceae bacterium SMB388]